MVPMHTVKHTVVLQSSAYRRRITEGTGSAPSIACGVPQAALYNQKLKDQTTCFFSGVGKGKEGKEKKKKSQDKYAGRTRC